MTPDDIELPRSGSINEPPGSNVLDKELPERPDEPPVLSMISPAMATIGGPDLTLQCVGSNFLPTTIITFNGGDEVTTFHTPTKVTTTVRPSTATTPGTYPVTVKHSGGESEPQMFTFNPAEEADPDELEAQIEEAEEAGDIKRMPPKRRR